MKIENIVDFTNNVIKNYGSMLVTRGKLGIRKIKYIYFSLDTRDGHVFNISLRQWFVKDSVDFTVHNEEDIQKIYEWLEDNNDE